MLRGTMVCIVGLYEPNTVRDIWYYPFKIKLGFKLQGTYPTNVEQKQQW